MHRASDRFEILRIKREWIQITVPADRIERMMRQGDARESGAIFDQNIDIFLLIDRDQLGRRMEIALGIRRAHFNLPLMVQVTLRNSHGTRRFEDEIIFFFNIVRYDPVSDAAGNDDVIFRAIGQFSENGFNHAATLKDEDDLIGATVFVILELVVRFRRFRPVCGHVLIEQHRYATGVQIPATRNVRRFQMMMAQRTIGDLFRFPMFD